MERGPEQIRKKAGFLMEGFPNDCLGCGTWHTTTKLSWLHACKRASCFSCHVLQGAG